MPTYVYRRADGTEFEIQQRITEAPLSVCPDTGQAVKRVISGNAGLIFKGSGFYLTDYARANGKGKPAESASSTPSGNAKTDAPAPASPPKASDTPASKD